MDGMFEFVLAWMGESYQVALCNSVLNVQNIYVLFCFGRCIHFPVVAMFEEGLH